MATGTKSDDAFTSSPTNPQMRLEQDPGVAPVVAGAEESRPWTLSEQLDLAIRIEKVAARIYAILAERFADSPEAQAMFSGLEQEEHQHALRIEMLGMTLARRPELQGAVALDVEKMQQALRDGEDVALLVSDPGRKMPLTLARQLAAGLEDKFAAVHAEQLTIVSEPSLHELFSIFVAQDREHAALVAGRKLRP